MGTIDTGELLLALGIVILTVIMLMFYSKCRRKFSKILFGFLSGVAVLYPISFLVTALGGTLCVNIFTVSVSAVLGIPGVVLLSVISFV